MWLCVTGPMAAGKNFASAILEQRGFAVVDADILAHGVVEDCKAQIVEAFGALARERHLELLNGDGTVNRQALGKLVFADSELLARQEAIVYPRINSLLDAFLSEHEGQDAAINATVLYKVPAIARIDAVLYIDATSSVRFARVRKRNGMAEEQIRARFRSQRHLFSKYKSANADIKKVWNIGTREGLERKIDRFLLEYRARG